MNLLRLFTLVVLLFSGVFLSFSVTVPSHNGSPSLSFLPVALADDDEDEEDEDEDEEEDEDEDEEEERASTPKQKTIRVVKEVIEYKPVTTTVIVTEEKYAKDSDGDTLVDAIDPDPLVSQKEYFTDSDDDGVPNALDSYPNEDDFAYYAFETDDNNNGILDSYEQF